MKPLEEYDDEVIAKYCRGMRIRNTFAEYIINGGLSNQHYPPDRPATCITSIKNPIMDVPTDEAYCFKNNKEFWKGYINKEDIEAMEEHLDKVFRSKPRKSRIALLDI